MAEFRANLFGVFRVKRDGVPISAFPTRKVRALFAYLLLHSGQTQPRERLAGLFWGESTADRARHNLSDALWRLRKLTGEGLLDEEGESIRLNSGHQIWTDHRAFTNAARLALVADVRSYEAQVLREAVELYTDELLIEFYDDWVLVERERCRGLYLSALQALAQAAEERNDTDEAVAMTERFLQAAPLRENAVRRLMRLYAASGKVHLGVETYHNYRRLAAEELGAQPEPETERLFEVLRTESRSMWRRVEVPRSDDEDLPFVGRKNELAKILLGLQEAVGGRGNVIIVLGEAGVGKTRLLQMANASAGWRGVQRLHATARQDADIAYGPLLRAMEPILSSRVVSLLHSALHLDERRMLARLSPMFAPLLSKHEGVANLQATSELFAHSLAQVLLALVRQHPHLWVIEDIHWADEETLRTLEIVISKVEDLPMIILLSARLGAARESGLMQTWLSRQEIENGAAILTLPPFSPEETRQFVAASVVGSEHRPDVDLLHRQSGGNAFFLRELLATRDDGDWFAASGMATATDSMEMIVQRRLDRLDADARAVLEQMAVLGLDVRYDVLNAATMLARDAFLRATDAPLRTRMIIEHAEGFHFAHDITRSVIAGNMSSSTWRRLHERAAEALQNVQPDAIEAIAEHWFQAQSWDQAMEALVRAGEKALAVANGLAAEGYFARAKLAWQRLDDNDPPILFDILDHRFQACLQIGDSMALMSIAQEMVETAEQSGEARTLALASLRMVYAQIKNGDFGAAALEADQANKLAVSAGAKDIEAMARVEQYRSSLIRDDAVIIPALRYFQEAGDLANEIDALRLLGTTNLRLCRLDMARVYARWLRDTADKAGNILEKWSAENLLAKIEHASGRFESALMTATAAYQTFARFDMVDGMAAASSTLANVYLALGQGEACRRWTDLFADHALATGSHLAETYILLHKAECETIFDAPEQGLAVAEQALEVWRAGRTQEYYTGVFIHWLLAHFSRRIGRPADAVAQTQQIPELAETEVRVGYMLLMIEAALAELALGRTENGLEWIDKGRAIRGRIEGEVRDSERLHFAHFRLLAALERGDEAASALASAWHDLAHKAQLISDPDLRAGFLGLADNQAIVEALDGVGVMNRYRLVYLPPKGTATTANAPIPVIWTAPDRDGGDAGARQACLRRLIDEAEQQGAMPVRAALAELLGVTERTVRRDLAVLREE